MTNARMRIGALFAALSIGVGLSACNAPSADNVNLVSQATVDQTVACDNVVGTLNRLSEAERATGEDQLDKLSKLGLEKPEQLTVAKGFVEARQKACTSTSTLASSSTTATTTTSVAPRPADDGKADAKNQSGGSLQNLPVLGAVPNQIAIGDTTGNPRTPAVAGADLLQKCKESARNWAQLAQCVGDQQWYIDGINAQRASLGFGWDDILAWAKLSVGFDTRLIHVFGMSEADKPKDVARREAAAKLGDPSIMKLEVVYHPSCFMNTRGLEARKMSPFVDCQRQVRVSLAPLVVENGKVVGLRADAGIFVDCLNPWALLREIVITRWDSPGVPKPTPSAPPQGGGNPPPAPPVSGPPPAAPPVAPPNGGGNPPPVVPPVTPPVGKNPALGSDPQGNAPTGGGQKDQPGPGAPTPAPVPTFRPDPYVPPVAPVAPAPAPTPPPVVQVPKPAATPAPQPTVAPSAQPPNHGTVPTATDKGCNNPEFCG